MINGNMDMIREMKNPFDYEEYVVRCKSRGVEPRGRQEFGQGMAYLHMGRADYPDLDWQEAYSKFFQKLTEEHEEVSRPTTEKKKKCCGKKKDKPLPPMTKRAMSYAKATAKWIKAGSPKVGRSEQLRRLAICNACDELNSDWHCSECGCPMKVKVERDMDNLCDLSKW
jgi:hypothetical protein